MRPLKTREGAEGVPHSLEFHAKLRTDTLAVIEAATGIQVEEVFSTQDPILQLFLSPRRMWKVVEVIVGHAVKKHVPNPDYSDLFDINDVFEWLEALIADFHPDANKQRISNVFRKLNEGTDEAIEKLLAKQAATDRIMENTDAIVSLMNNPRALEALAGGSGANSASIPAPTVSAN